MHNDPNLWANRIYRSLNRYRTIDLCYLVTRTGGREHGKLFTGVRFMSGDKIFEVQVKEVRNA